MGRHSALAEMSAGAGEVLTLSRRLDGRPLGREEIAAWLVDAVAGDELHYASAVLSKGVDGPKWLRLLSEQGLVLLYQVRIDGVMEYFARRTRAPLPRRDDAAVTHSRSAQECERLLAVLALYSVSRPAPTNAELARLAGIDGAVRVSDRLKMLRSRGLIQAEVDENGDRWIHVLQRGGFQ